MAYKPTVWVYGETPVNAENLNKLEAGVSAAVVSVNGISPDANGNVEITIPDSSQNVNQGGGLSTTAINLLIDILKVGMFTTNVSGKIESLQEVLLAGSSGDSGGDSGGGGETVADEITFADGMLTIITVGSDVSVANGMLTIL